MSEAYLKEMLEYRKNNDTASLVKCRRQRLDNLRLSKQGSYVPDKVRRLTREQAEGELAQLRRRFAWDDDLSLRQLSDRLKILASCGYYTISSKAEQLSKFLPVRDELLKVRQEGDIEEDLWELICFSLIDQRAYILNADFWGRLDGRTISVWKTQLKEFRHKHSRLALACEATVEGIQTKLKELSYLAGSAKAGKDNQPVMNRLMEREERRTRQQHKSFELTGAGHGSNNWHLVLIAIFVISGLARGFMRESNSSHNGQLQNNLRFASEQSRLHLERLRQEKLKQLSKSQDYVLPGDPNWNSALSRAKASTEGFNRDTPNVDQNAPQRLLHATDQELKEAMRQFMDPNNPLPIVVPDSEQPGARDDASTLTLPGSNPPPAEGPLNP